jgi:outer membrane protein assembly factor BamB
MGQYPVTFTPSPCTSKTARAAQAMVIVATESNNVYALNASNGSIIWQRNVGTPITSGLPCGNINPLGITGTPIVDLASRSLFFDAETTPTAGTFKHMIYSLNVDTGDINPGWPVDVSAVVPGFDSSVQSQRAALAIARGILYVPYGGRFGDCGNYRGRLVGVQISNPSGVMAWATTAIGGGVWGVGGVAVDDINPFVVTGNTFNTGGVWSGGEAVISFPTRPDFYRFTQRLLGAYELAKPR